jgi:glycosyltransferase involved in cell wall biosynthesis
MLATATVDAQALARNKFHLAQAWHFSRKIERAIAGYREAIKLDPQALLPYQFLGSLLLAEERFEEAEEFYVQALQQHPQAVRFRKNLTDLIIKQRGLDATFEFYGLSQLSQEPQIADNAILACLVVRNESQHLPYLLSYYRQQGVDQFLIVDNGATDETIDYLIIQTDVALWHGDRPLHQVNFGSLWFELLLQKYGVEHWCLTINADEVLYYPDCETRTIRDLCVDLDRQYQRAFTAILLDMYSDRPISATHYEMGQPFLEICPYFDRAFFHQAELETEPEFAGQRRYVGGMRQRVFGRQGDYYLNKVPLLKYRPDLILTGGQHLLGLSSEQIAQETGALLHFKYFASFPAYVNSEVERKEHSNGAFQYQEYAAKLRQDANLMLYDPQHSLRLQNSQQLVDLGIMHRASQQFPDKWTGSGGSQPHILFYSDCFGLYGATQWSHAMMISLLHRGYRISSAQFEVHDRLTDAQAAAGVQHHWLPVDNTYSLNVYPNYFYNHSEPYQLFTQIRPDLIIFANGGPASDLAAAEVAKDLGIPYIPVVHCATPDWARQYAAYLDRLPAVYEKANAVVTVSEENLKLMHELFRLEPYLGQVIYNGRPQSYFQARDCERRSRLRQEWGIPADGILCFTAARLDPCKGYQYQIMAIQKLRQEACFSQLYFVWVGRGRVSDRLRKMVKELGLEDRVRFLGERTDVAELLDAADIFVLPSQFEGMPLAIMEAMAKGVPVIASAVSGIPEELGETGMLLPDPKLDSQATIDTLANTLKDWASHPEKLAELGQACRERAIAYFREETMLAQYFRLIEPALSQPSCIYTKA